MIYTIITAAGSSDEFQRKGFSLPKNLLIPPGRDKSVLTLAIDSYQILGSTLRVAIQESEEAAFSTTKQMGAVARRDQFVLVPQNSRGAAISAAYCMEGMTEDGTVIVSAGDSEVADGVESEISSLLASGADAGSVVFRDRSDRWSFLATDSRGKVVDVAEKYSIGEFASTGLFFFRSASSLFDAIEWSLTNNFSTNGAYYVSTLLNFFLLQGKSVAFEEIDIRRYKSWARPSDFQEAE